MASYVVTGCAGFIGSHVVEKLLNLGHNVIGIDNFSTGQQKYIEPFIGNKGFILHCEDLVTSKNLTKFIDGANTIFHLAANADIRGGLKHPYKDLEQNTIATFRVLEAMRVAGISRIVFSSTAASLGEPDTFPTPECCPIPIQTSLYGASKMACEGLISAYCEGYGFEGYAFRFVSILGPRYPHGHVFDFVSQLLNDRDRLNVLGDGNQRKSYLHVFDCVDAIIKIAIDMRTAKNSKHNFEVYHLGVQDYCNIRQSAAWIADEMKLAPEIIFKGGERGWVGDNPFVYLDIEKAKSTGWNPLIGIEESVRETVRWLLANQWIFKSRG